MPDLATRIDHWLEGTVTPGPDGSWVVDARWTGIKGMVFDLPDDAARAAYLDRARPHAVRAAIARCVWQISNAGGLATMVLSMVLDAFDGGVRADHSALLWTASGLFVLAFLVVLQTSLHAFTQRRWLRRSGTAHPGTLVPPPHAPLPTPRGAQMFGFLLTVLACVGAGAAFTVSTAACSGWLSVPAASCRERWLDALLACVSLAAAGAHLTAAWRQHRLARV
jgi:hypothetical protein